MKYSEFLHIVAAIIILTIVGSFQFVVKGNWTSVPLILFYSALIIAVAVFSKKLIAYMLDSGVEHEIWSVYRFGFKQDQHFDKAIPAGIIIPLIISVISLGMIKVGNILTYETRALKYRASKRFGHYSFVEMTDWHNGVIGAAGILALLALAIIAYFVPTNAEYLAKLSVFYAFWNLIPISKSDGSQIFFGSRILWTILAVITVIFTLYAIVL